MTSNDFNLAISRNRLRPRTREALRLVFVDGRRWREAQRITGVAQSTIMRAARRIGLLNKENP